MKRRPATPVAIYAAASVPYFLLVEAEVWAWPAPLVRAVDRARPVVWGAARSESVYPLLREWDNTRFDVREFAADAHVYARLSLREAALTGAALFTLLTTTPEHTR